MLHFAFKEISTDTSHNDCVFVSGQKFIVTSTLLSERISSFIRKYRRVPDASWLKVNANFILYDVYGDELIS